jgi:uncharacterized damage-inducible protein DinB
MTIAEARQLLAYCEWANTRLFAAAEALAAEQLAAEAVSSFPSVRATLGHILGSEWIWMRRWEGGSPAAAPGWVEGASLPELRGHHGRVQSDRDEYMAGLTDEDLNRVIGYRTLAGKEAASPLADIIRHVVNHSTYHRGQVATQLRQLGVTPPSTDLVAYLRLPK